MLFLIIFPLISITNGIHFEINFPNSSFRHLLDKRILPETPLWSFFSTKIDNVLIYDDTNVYTTLAAASCVHLFRETSKTIESIFLQSMFRPFCDFVIPGNKIDENHGMLAKTYMCPLKGKVREATIYIYNKNVDYPSEPNFIVIIEGCYYFSANRSKIEISWIISADLFIYKEIFKNFKENLYDIYLSKKINFQKLGSGCNSLCEIHVKSCREGIEEIEKREKFESGIVFIYFILGLIALIFIVLLFNWLKKMFWRRKNSVRPIE